MGHKLFLVLGVAAFVFALSQYSFAEECGGAAGAPSMNQQMAQAASAQKEALPAQPEVAKQEAMNVGNKICPVSGEKVDSMMPATYEYEGKIYNFCCAGCIEEFKKDPQKYIQKVNEELKPVTQEAPVQQAK